MNKDGKEKLDHPYKIMKGDVVTIKRTDYGDFTFYNIPVTKTGIDGEKVAGEKGVRFNKDIELEDNTQIRVLDFYEDFYKKGFQTIFTLFISEFEIVDRQQALEEYNNIMYDNDEELPF